MNLSGKYYLPIVTADPANPRVMETANIGFFLMKDCFGRDNFYISGLGGKSLLQGPNFIWSNTKLNRIEYSAPGRESITGTYSCPTGAIIMSEDSYISGANYSAIFGGFRNLISRTKEYASGEVVDTTNLVLNSLYCQTFDCDQSSIENSYNSLMLNSTGSAIVHSSGIVIDENNVNSYVLNASNKYIEGGKNGIFLVTDGDDTPQYFNDSKTANLLFSNGVRIFPRINISTDPAYDYVNVKDSLDTRIKASGLYKVILSGVSGNVNLSQVWDISHLYTVPNRFSDITIGTSNKSPIYYDITGMSPSWGNNTAFRHLTQSVIVGHANIGCNESAVFGGRNTIKSQTNPNSNINFILNQEVGINPADKNVSVFGFYNFVTGSDTNVFGLRNTIIGGLYNNLVIGTKNQILQASGDLIDLGDGSLILPSSLRLDPKAAEAILIGNNNREKIGTDVTILGNNNKSTSQQSVIVGTSNNISGMQNSNFGVMNYIEGNYNVSLGKQNSTVGTFNNTFGQFNNHVRYTGFSGAANYNTAVGFNNYLGATFSTVIGTSNKIIDLNATDSGFFLKKNYIAGDDNTSYGNYNNIYGFNNYLRSSGSLAVGSRIIIDKAERGIGLGISNTIYAKESMALGQNNIIRDNATNGIALGFGGDVRNASELVISSGPFYNSALAQRSQLAWKGVTTGNYLKSIYLNGKEINTTTKDFEGLAVIPSGMILNGTLNLLAVSDKYNSDGKFAARKYHVALENSGNGVKINNLSLINAYNKVGATNWGIGLTGYQSTGLLMVVSGTSNDNIYWHVVGDFNVVSPLRFTVGAEQYVDVPKGNGVDSILSINKLTVP
jgi:hypothetical protein